MGKRLGGPTRDQTKCMVRLNEKCLIEYTIEALLYFNIKKIIIVVGYKAENLKSFRDEHFKNIEIIYVEEKQYV